MGIKFLVFLILNFSALFIGAFFTGDGVPSEWYQELNKAPWTPPGWVFGFSWTTIMICLAFYMALALDVVKDKKNLLVLYSIQLVLNILWNPFFFAMHQVLLSLVVISGLTILVAYILFSFRKKMDYKSFLIAPYLTWLIIATSLNVYILIYN
jgi:benzodiazapine receptor